MPLRPVVSSRPDFSTLASVVIQGEGAMQSSTALESVLKRDRLIVLGGLLGITGLAWAYTGYLAWGMGCMDMAMPHMQTWGAIDLVLLVIMWSVMMVAMMVPSAAPMILMYTMINRRRREQQQPYVPTAVFLGGYLLVWAGFSILATLAQWGLHSAALLSSMMVSTSPIMGGLVLLAAGIFQWTPLKYTDFSVVRFRPNLMLFSEKNRMKVRKNQWFLTMPYPLKRLAGATS
jgi:predicted metal-binding membrane protein